LTKQFSFLVLFLIGTGPGRLHFLDLLVHFLLQVLVLDLLRVGGLLLVHLQIARFSDVRPSLPFGLISTAVRLNQKQLEIKLEDKIKALSCK
jgi:hypothetical protein